MNPYSYAIDPTLLSTFLAVAEIGKIAHAAKVLNLSQPAVTAHIRKLEADLKTQLFTRSIHGVVLTAEGTRFLDYAKKISALINEASLLNQSSIDQHAVLNIFASTTIGNHLLPPILCDYSKRFKNLSIKLEVMSTNEVIKRMQAGDVSLGMVEGLSRASHVRLEKVIDDELFPVIHPEFKNRVQTLDDFKKFHLIGRERGSGTRTVLEKFLKEHFSKKDLIFQYELGSSEAIKTAVIQKLGIGFLSRWSIQHELNTNQLAIINLDKLKINRCFSLVYPSGALKTIESNFIDFLKSHPSVNRL